MGNSSTDEFEYAQYGKYSGWQHFENKVTTTEKMNLNRPLLRLCMYGDSKESEAKETPVVVRLKLRKRRPFLTDTQLETTARRSN